MSRLTKAWRNTRLYGRLRAKRLPQLLIVGAQKGGTSALYSYLAQHPHFAPSSYKELSFFGSDLRFGYGLDWYCAQWDREIPSKAIRFEASPLYLVTPRSPARIRDCLPTVKLIAILRDPIERAFSSWQMYRRQLAGDPDFYRTLVRTYCSPEERARIDHRSVAELDDFELAVEREIEGLERGRSMEWSVVELGLYGPQLARYYDVFPREQILVLDSRELRTNRIGVLNRVLHFMGLPTWDWSGANLGDVFVGNSHGPIPRRASDSLRDYYRESNRMLTELLPNPPQFVREERVRRLSA